MLGARWSPDGGRLAIMLRAIDNKDRWLVTVAPGRDGATLSVEDRLTDEAWIGWSFNDFGWLPEGRELWAREGLAPESAEGRAVVTFAVPAALLSPGHYVVTLGPSRDEWDAEFVFEARRAR